MVCSNQISLSGPISAKYHGLLVTMYFSILSIQSTIIMPRSARDRQLQLVSVCYTRLLITVVPFSTGISCGDLPAVDNAVITYNSTTLPRPIATVATYSCNTGYALEGIEIKTCVELDDGTVEFDPQETPSCVRKSQLYWGGLNQSLLRISLLIDFCS